MKGGVNEKDCKYRWKHTTGMERRMVIVAVGGYAAEIQDKMWYGVSLIDPTHVCKFISNHPPDLGMILWHAQYSPIITIFQSLTSYPHSISRQIYLYSTP